MRCTKKTKCLLYIITGILFVGFAVQVFMLYVQPKTLKYKVEIVEPRNKTLVSKTDSRPAAAIDDTVPSKAGKKYHLLINSYMNCGSRFTGSMFGFTRGAFYFYEPLWTFSVWEYYHVPNKVCSQAFPPVKCRNSSPRVVNTGKIRGRSAALVKNMNSSTITDMMIGVLQDIYSCRFSRIENLVTRYVHDNPELAGPSWGVYFRCIRARQPKSKCLREQERVCKNSSHIVTKVLRLTTYALDKLLSSNDNIKVIQLFRDPRAIINSRYESKGYPVKDFNVNSQVLCDKMLLDYHGGIQLLEKYPDRFKFVFYEDIKADVVKRIPRLHEFIGMNVSKEDITKLNRVKVNPMVSRKEALLKTRVLDNANWWRYHLGYSRTKMVQDRCFKLFPLFNMTFFKDANELMDTKIPSLKLPDRLRVL